MFNLLIKYSINIIVTWKRVSALGKARDYHAIAGKKFYNIYWITVFIILANRLTLI